MLYWNGDPEGPLPVGLITVSEPVETVQVVCVIFTMAGAGIPGCGSTTIDAAALTQPEAFFIYTE